MARFAVGAAALIVICQAEAQEAVLQKDAAVTQSDIKQHQQEEPRKGLASNSGINIWDWLFPYHVPSSDKCGVNCYKLCGEGLGRKGGDCSSTCFAHSIETTRAAQFPFPESQ